MNLLVSSSDLAKVLRLTVQRVNQLAKEGVIKREADGKFNLPDRIEDYYAFKFKTDEEIDYEREHALLEAAKREKAEIELEQLKGSLLNAVDVEQAMSSMILTAKSRLLSVPTKAATRVIGQKNLSVIVEILKSEICNALDELKEMPAPPGDDTDAAD
jgi:phage terminase Nu1 subunit (DNA packaging protein)